MAGRALVSCVPPLILVGNSGQAGVLFYDILKWKVVRKTLKQCRAKISRIRIYSRCLPREGEGPVKVTAARADGGRRPAPAAPGAGRGEPRRTEREVAGADPADGRGPSSVW